MLLVKGVIFPSESKWNMDSPHIGKKKKQRDSQALPGPLHGLPHARLL